MRIELYDRVMLKTGETAFIVHIYEQGVAYEADVELPDGETETRTTKEDDILRVIPDKAE